MLIVNAYNCGESGFGLIVVAGLLWGRRVHGRV